MTDMLVVYWGTYDIGKPRNRIMIRGLKENGVRVIECHANIWKGVEDKSQLPGTLEKLRTLVRWVSCYPRILYRYLLLPKHDAVIIGYMGHLDVLVLWLFAKLRSVPIVWDAFMSIYDTVAEDRRLLGPKHPLARLIFVWEWLACRAADIVVLDTAAHAQYFIDSFHLRPEKVKRVFVGAETDIFLPEYHERNERTKKKRAKHFTALFYGQFIPLHGIETVVKAAKLTESNGIRWILIGRGQESVRICKLLEKLKPGNVDWIEWVPYEDLLGWIRAADVCLGIFGDTEKAKRVIPNKVFQILAAGRPLITADTPAIREFLSASNDVILVPISDPQSLANSVSRMSMNRENSQMSKGTSKEFRMGPKEVGQDLKRILVDSKLSKYANRSNAKEMH